MGLMYFSSLFEYFLSTSKREKMLYMSSFSLFSIFLTYVRLQLDKSKRQCSVARVIHCSCLLFRISRLFSWFQVLFSSFPTCLNILPESVILVNVLSSRFLSLRVVCSFAKTYNCTLQTIKNRSGHNIVGDHGLLTCSNVIVLSFYNFYLIFIHMFRRL